MRWGGLDVAGGGVAGSGVVAAALLAVACAGPRLDGPVSTLATADPVGTAVLYAARLDPAPPEQPTLLRGLADVVRSPSILLWLGLAQPIALAQSLWDAATGDYRPGDYQRHMRAIVSNIPHAQPVDCQATWNAGLAFEGCPRPPEADPDPP